MGSSRGSDSVPLPLDSPAGSGMQGHTDSDPLGVGKRGPGPGSVQSDMTDEGSVSKVAGRPAAGWKGRMSSMLLRGPLTSPKSDTIKAKKVAAEHLLMHVFCRHLHSLHSACVASVVAVSEFQHLPLDGSYLVGAAQSASPVQCIVCCVMAVACWVLDNLRVQCITSCKWSMCQCVVCYHACLAACAEAALAAHAHASEAKQCQGPHLIWCYSTTIVQGPSMSMAAT